jgi:hypothetical protein
MKDYYSVIKKKKNHLYSQKIKMNHYNIRLREKKSNTKNYMQYDDTEVMKFLKLSGCQRSVVRTVD